MTSTTLIRNAAWAVVWDAAARRHTYMPSADIVFSGNTISFVGRDFQEPADHEIDGRHLLVMPGHQSK